MNGELFELELLGGTTEQRFRRMRPEVEAMPGARFSCLRSRRNSGSPRAKPGRARPIKSIAPALLAR